MQFIFIIAEHEMNQNCYSFKLIILKTLKQIFPTAYNDVMYSNVSILLETQLNTRYSLIFYEMKYFCYNVIESYT